MGENVNEEEQNLHRCCRKHSHRKGCHLTVSASLTLILQHICMAPEYYFSLQRGLWLSYLSFRCVNCAVQQSIENSLTKASSLHIQRHVQEEINSFRGTQWSVVKFLKFRWCCVNVVACVSCLNYQSHNMVEIGRFQNHNIARHLAVNCFVTCMRGSTSELVFLYAIFVFGSWNPFWFRP